MLSKERQTERCLPRKWISIVSLKWQIFLFYIVQFLGRFDHSSIKNISSATSTWIAGRTHNLTQDDFNI